MVNVNKKGIMGTGEIIAAVIALLVILALLLYSPKITNLLKLAVGNQPEENENIGNTNLPETIKNTFNLKGEIGLIAIIKSDAILSKNRPTSPDYCFVGASIKNTGDQAWDSGDKVRVVLFCKHLKNQLDNAIIVQNYPALGDYVQLNPGEQKEAIFSRSPDVCIKSLDKYKIVMYANCNGSGNENQPCDNIDANDPPVVMSSSEFQCKVE